MSNRTLLLSAMSAAALVLPLVLTASADASAVGSARPAAARAASCNVFNYTGAHWSTKVAKSAVVTHAYQLNLPHNGTYTETKSESAVHTVKSSVSISASLKASEGAIFESIEVTAKASVAHFGKNTGTKSVTDTISIHNTGGQTAYVMFSGVTRYTGTAMYHNCVSRTSSGIGTVKVTHKAPWQTYSGTGGGAVQCGAKKVTALAKAAEKYC